MTVMTWSEVQSALLSAERGSTQLDQMIWARLSGVAYPLTHYDRATFDECKLMTGCEASLSTNLNACMAFLDHHWPGSSFNVRCDGNSAQVFVYIRIENGVTSKGVVSSKDRSFRMDEIALYFAGALMKAHDYALKIQQRLLPLIGLLEKAPPMKEWDIEEFDGGFSSINHEFRLCGYPHPSREEAQGLADVIRHNYVVILNTSERYEALFPTSDSPDVKDMNM